MRWDLRKISVIGRLRRYSVGGKPLRKHLRAAEGSLLNLGWRRIPEAPENNPPPETGAETPRRARKENLFCVSLLGGFLGRIRWGLRPQPVVDSITVLLNRERAANGEPLVNHKRVCRLAL